MYNIFSDKWVLPFLQLFPWYVFIELVLANIKQDLWFSFYKLQGGQCLIYMYEALMIIPFSLVWGFVNKWIAYAYKNQRIAGIPNLGTRRAEGQGYQRFHTENTLYLIISSSIKVHNIAKPNLLYWIKKNTYCLWLH